MHAAGGIYRQKIAVDAAGSRQQQASLCAVQRTVSPGGGHVRDSHDAATCMTSPGDCCCRPGALGALRARALPWQAVGKAWDAAGRRSAEQLGQLSRFLEQADQADGYNAYRVSASSFENRGLYLDGGPQIASLILMLLLLAIAFERILGLDRLVNNAIKCETPLPPCPLRALGLRDHLGAPPVPDSLERVAGPGRSDKRTTRATRR